VLDDATRRRLRYVKTAGASDLAGFPDFLIVGPQRTGTTWLHAHLRYHPEIFLAEPKELFFFSRLKPPGHPKFQSDELEWYLRFFRDPAWRWLGKNAISLWRQRRLYHPRVRGEATASYAALDRDVIEDIAALNPDIKVIMMIRDPIDRAWSHAKKDLVRKTKRRVADVPEPEFRAFFTDPYQRQCARYVDNCDNWVSALRPGHLLLSFFEDVQAEPERLLLEVMAFLGVTADHRYIDADVRASVNPTEGTRIPEEYRRLLAELFAPDLAKLRERFGVSWPLGPHPLTIRLP
jgi:hypothetical protein